MKLFTLLNIDPISEGYVILITGLTIVFFALISLSLFFKFGLPFLLNLYSLAKKGKAKKSIEIVTTNKKEFTGEVAAAISVAIHLYLNEQHDDENAVLTIKQARKLYSPWSSKIYGTQNRL